MAELVEIRILIAADDMKHGEAILAAVSDTLSAAVGEARYGAVLFEGINPNGTEVPEGFRVVVEEEASQIPGLYVVPGLEPDEADEAGEVEVFHGLMDGEPLRVAQINGDDDAADEVPV